MQDAQIGLDEALPVLQKHWRCRTEECRESVLVDLREDLARAEAILRLLIMDGKADYRVWAMWTAPRVLPKPRAAAVLQAAVEREHRHDYVDIAIGELRDLDVELVRPYLPRLRRRLGGKDWHTMAFVFWLMADLRDAHSVPVIERTMERALQANLPYVAKLGSVIVSVIHGDDAAVLLAIREHDHDRMTWLVEAARRMNTPEGRAVLDACATSDFDLDCRKTCRTALLQGRARVDETNVDEIRRQLRSEFGPGAVPGAPPVRTQIVDAEGLKRIEEVQEDGQRSVIYERPPSLVLRLLRRLLGRSTDRN